MSEEYNYADYTEIKVTVKLPQLERVCAIMSVIDVNLMIEDYSDLSLGGIYGDLIDEAILSADKSIASVSVFLPEGGDTDAALAFLRERLSDAGIEAKIGLVGVHEADYANAWRQYYKPLHIGKSIVIVPEWEKYTPAAGEIIVHMDPGMAFGTGSHETTRLVIGMLEKHVRDGCTLLDVGCGSGILAICGAKLGASDCRAYDIDPIAVGVARKNVGVNGCADRVKCETSDLLADIPDGKYDIICANIVADIIIRMMPDIGRFMNENSTFIASGIITERAGDVADAVDRNRLYVAMTAEDNGWCAMEIKKTVQ